MLAGDLHTRTAVAGSALHLLLLTDPTVWHTDRRTDTGRHLAVKEQTYRRCWLLHILAYVFSSHVAAVLTGWRTRRTVIDRNISVELECYFGVISQFFSRTSCVFECPCLINGKRRITAHMTSSSIFYGKGVSVGLCAGHICNGELYEIKLWFIQNDGRVSVSVMCQTTAIGECFDVPQ